MIKDISFGQYVQGNSLLHTLDARTKIFAVIIYIVMLFCAKNAAALFACFAVLVALYLTAKIPIRMITKSLKPIMPIILITAVLNLFFVSGDDILWQWKWITVTRQGVFFAVVLSLRIICLISATTLLTYTTSPMQLTDALEQLMSPLAKIGFPAHELSMMMTIALRFIPTLIEETDKIMSAQKARGASLDTGNLKQRIKALIPILVPLFVSAFRRADELALAMECRCYHGGKGRTKLSSPKMRAADFAAMAVCAVMLAAVIVSNGYFTAVI